jgi:hypothetical protein
MKSRCAEVTLTVLAVFFLVLVFAIPAWAQERPAQPRVLTNPSVNCPAHFDISPPLRDMAAQAAPQQGVHQAPLVLHPKLDLLSKTTQQAQGPVVDGALQTGKERAVGRPRPRWGLLWS